jgi:hypothetical protein
MEGKCCRQIVFIVIDHSRFSSYHIVSKSNISVLWCVSYLPTLPISKSYSKVNYPKLPLVSHHKIEGNRAEQLKIQNQSKLNINASILSHCPGNKVPSTPDAPVMVAALVRPHDIHVCFYSFVVGTSLRSLQNNTLRCLI